MKHDKDIHNDVIGQTEDALQQKCITWFWNTFPHLRGLLFSVPNGGERSARQGKTLNLTGLVSGVSDLILLYRGKVFCIELKKDYKSNQSSNQIEWQSKVESQGIPYFVVRSLNEFKILINTII